MKMKGGAIVGFIIAFLLILVGIVVGYIIFDFRCPVTHETGIGAFFKIITTGGKC